MDHAFLSWLTPIISTLVITAGQLALNARFKHAEVKREASQAETDAKRRAEAEWRESINHRMDAQDERISAILQAQCSQMRSDIIHKCHRYLDDLGRASIEEKNALKAEHEEYEALCKADDIVNNFVDLMVQRVMELPERDV